MYKHLSDLPEGIRNNLPEEAQELYFEVYNNSYETYVDMDDETVKQYSHRRAWSAVKIRFGLFDTNGHNWQEH